MILGVPVPIALMAGYCTLVGAVYLAMARSAVNAIAASRSRVPSNQLTISLVSAQMAVQVQTSPAVSGAALAAFTLAFLA